MTDVDAQTIIRAIGGAKLARALRIFTWPVYQARDKNIMPAKWKRVVEEEARKVGIERVPDSAFNYKPLASELVGAQGDD